MSIALHFTKGQGTGNDFIVYSDADGDLPLSPVQIAKLCDRHFGIGADGVIRAVLSSKLNRKDNSGKVTTDPAGKKALAEDSAAEWFMDYHNADGSLAEMCGNGIRVFVRYLIESGFVEVAAGNSLAVGTRAGVKDVTASSSGIQVDLGRWQLTGVEPSVKVAGIPVVRPGLGIDVGNPHVVVAFADDVELQSADLSQIPQLDPEPENGANVEIVVPGDPLVKDGVGHISMRVHERGSGETLSCGTGVVAAALATRYWAGSSAPNNWKVDVPGGTLAVRMFPTEEGEHVALSGPAELSYTGTVELN